MIDKPEYSGWRKSSFSGSSGNCVEVGRGARVVAVRDSKQGGRGPVLEVSASAWREFLASAKSGGLDSNHDG